jgi:hypothetical protein
MSLEPIPKNWIALLENDNMVQRWHRETENGTLPTETAQQTISYIQRHYNQDTHRMIGTQDGMPQCFVHWWSHMLIGQVSDLYSFEYPVMKHWRDNIEKKHREFYSGELTDIGVITIMETWIDIIFTDMVLFEDEWGESHRSKIPRLYCGEVVCVFEEKPATRAHTLEYIKAGGTAIFRERGFKEGEEYWKHICTKYTL